MKDDFSCKCGHDKAMHSEHFYCYECLKSIEHDFIPDNLKQLEKILKQKENSNV
jgi:hypothetical protein